MQAIFEISVLYVNLTVLKCSMFHTKLYAIYFSPCIFYRLAEFTSLVLLLAVKAKVRAPAVPHRFI